MRLHYIQHVPFEDPAHIFVWAKQRKIVMTGTQTYRSFSFPRIEDSEGLIVMGGPMGVHDEQKHTWLTREKQFIEAFIQSGKPVLGICLGAQLIADVLGASVYQNPEREIGWFPVQITAEAGKSPVRNLPVEMTAFHWHGDTFDIPANAFRLAQSEACPNQAFQYGAALGLQFHLESTVESIQRLVQHCSDDLSAGLFVQSEEEILTQASGLTQTSWDICDQLLDEWISQV